MGKLFLASLPAALLAACTVVPAPDSTPAEPQGAAVALGQSVRVGEVTVTPVAVVEDSRCPINVRCVWAGRLVVRTQIDGRDAQGTWSLKRNLELGKSETVVDRIFALVSGEPGKTAERETRPEEYRFTYEAR